MNRIVISCRGLFACFGFCFVVLILFFFKGSSQSERPASPSTPRRSRLDSPAEQGRKGERRVPGCWGLAGISPAADPRQEPGRDVARIRNNNA